MSEVDIFKRACALFGKGLDAQDTKDMSMDELRREVANTRIALFDVVEYVSFARSETYNDTQTLLLHTQLDKKISDSYNDSKSKVMD